MLRFQNTAKNQTVVGSLSFVLKVLSDIHPHSFWSILDTSSIQRLPVLKDRHDLCPSINHIVSIVSKKNLLPLLWTVLIKGHGRELFMYVLLKLFLLVDFFDHLLFHFLYLV